MSSSIILRQKKYNLYKKRLVLLLKKVEKNRKLYLLFLN